MSEYYKTKKILEKIPGTELCLSRAGSGFRFPVYMNEKLAGAEIEVLELSARSSNCLRRAGIRTIGDFCERIQRSCDLKSIRNCGKTSAAEIMDKFFAYHYSNLRPEEQDGYLKKIIEMNGD